MASAQTPGVQDQQTGLAKRPSDGLNADRAWRGHREVDPQRPQGVRSVRPLTGGRSADRESREVPLARPAHLLAPANSAVPGPPRPQAPVQGRRPASQTAAPRVSVRRRVPVLLRRVHRGGLPRASSLARRIERCCSPAWRPSSGRSQNASPPAAYQQCAGPLPRRERARAEGRPEVSGEAILALAEQIAPSVKQAIWLDRAEAAVAQLEQISLRDLRTTVAAAAPRDEAARELDRKLREELDRRVKKLRASWEEQISHALEEGRVLQALRFSAQPPEPTARFPAGLVERLAASAGAAMTASTPIERWLALLDAAAASPIRRQIHPEGLPEDPSGEVVRRARLAAGSIPALAPMIGLPMPPPPKPIRGARPPRPPRPRTNQGGLPACLHAAGCQESRHPGCWRGPRRRAPQPRTPRDKRMRHRLTLPRPALVRRSTSKPIKMRPNPSQQEMTPSLRPSRKLLRPELAPQDEDQPASPEAPQTELAPQDESQPEPGGNEPGLVTSQNQASPIEGAPREGQPQTAEDESGLASPDQAEEANPEASAGGMDVPGAVTDTPEPDGTQVVEEPSQAGGDPVGS